MTEITYTTYHTTNVAPLNVNAPLSSGQLHEQDHVDLACIMSVSEHPSAAGGYEDLQKELSILIKIFK